LLHFLTIVREWHFVKMPLLRIISCKQRHGAQHLIIMERPASDLQTVDYAASREGPWGRRSLMAGLMLAAFASRALMPRGFMPASEC
jgi:hypothetical protein